MPLLNFMEIEEVKREVAKIIKDELSAGHLAFFFGSRITGAASKRSDLDVGIEEKSGKEVPFNVLSKIRGRCEALPTLFTVDVVDFSKISEDFKKVAKEKVEMIG